MKTAAAKGRRLSLLAAVCLIASLLVVPSADASRNIKTSLEPVLSQPAMPDLVFEGSGVEPQPRHRLFGDLSLLERPLDLVAIQKTASGVFSLGIQSNIRQTGSLGQNRSGPSFQGLWTDPVTGISYARNRWYDARTASWLSEDPLGAVDSPNLYAFVGWGPHVGRDPMGLAGLVPESDLPPCTGVPWAHCASEQSKVAEIDQSLVSESRSISEWGPDPGSMQAIEGETFPGMFWWAADSALAGALTHEDARFQLSLQEQADIRAFRERWGFAADTLDLAAAVVGGKKFEIFLAAAVFAVPDGPQVLENENALGPEGRHVANELSQMTIKAEDLLDSGEAVTDRARQYKRFDDEGRWYAFFFRGRAIQDEVEVMLAQSGDPLLQRVEIRPKKISGIPDFVFHQSTGEEVVLDITSPRSYTRHKALKYVESGREIIIEIYHRGRGMKRK